MKDILLILSVAILFTACGTKQQPATKTVQPETMTAVVPSVQPAAPAESTPAAPQKPASTKPATPPAQPPTSEKPAALPKLWDFFATWCPPCKKQAPIIEELATEYQGKIEIISIDTDKNPDLARKFQIQAIPTLVFLDAEGKELSRQIGFFPKDSIVARFKAHGFIR